jgi:hypothetical protein
MCDGGIAAPSSEAAHAVLGTCQPGQHRSLAAPGPPQDGARTAARRDSVTGRASDAACGAAVLHWTIGST